MNVRFVNNRREIKYLVSNQDAQTFRQSVANTLVSDTQNFGQGYLNYSIYFDSPQFTFYNEHKKGLLNRYKPRLRIYKDNYKAPPAAIFLEFKYREQNLITKERAVLSPIQANKILKGDAINEIADIKVSARVFGKFAAITTKMSLRPLVGVLYHRMPFSCSYQSDFRVTFDSRIQFTDNIGLVPSEDAFENWHRTDYVIIELKYQSHVPNQILKSADQMGFEQINYSKYASAIEQVYGATVTAMP